MITELRSGLNVKRFHTTHRTQEETVGHHSANVAAILLRLAPDCSRNLLVAALMHDVPEVYTGDVPAPFKWDHPKIKSGLKGGEFDYIRDYNVPDPQLEPAEEVLLKLADMLDLVLSSLEEVNRGNFYAKELVRNGQDYIKQMYEDGKIDDETVELIGAMVLEVKQCQPMINR